MRKQRCSQIACQEMPLALRIEQRQRSKVNSYLTRNHSSKMRTVRFCGSGGGQGTSGPMLLLGCGLSRGQGILGGRVYTLEGIWAQRYPALRIKGHGTRYQERTCHHRYPTIPVYRQTPMKTLRKAQPLPCTRTRTSFVKCLTPGNVHTCST